MRTKKDIYTVDVNNLSLKDLKKQKRILEKVTLFAPLFPANFMAAIYGVIKLYEKLTPKKPLMGDRYYVDKVEVSVKKMKIQKHAILKLGSDDLKCKRITKSMRNEMEGILSLYDHIQDDIVDNQGAKEHDVFTLQKGESKAAEKKFADQWHKEMRLLNNHIAKSEIKVSNMFKDAMRVLGSKK